MSDTPFGHAETCELFYANDCNKSWSYALLNLPVPWIFTCSSHCTWFFLRSKSALIMECIEKVRGWRYALRECRLYMVNFPPRLCSSTPFNLSRSQYDAKRKKKAWEKKRTFSQLFLIPDDGTPRESPKIIPVRTNRTHHRLLIACKNSEDQIRRLGCLQLTHDQFCRHVEVVAILPLSSSMQHNILLTPSHPVTRSSVECESFKWSMNGSKNSA